MNIHYFTVYALSTENLNRPEKELKGLFDLYIEGLKDIADDDRIHENRVKVQIIGRRELLPESVNEAITYAEKKPQITMILPSLFALHTVAERK